MVNAARRHQLVEYTPAANFFGIDSFTYTVSDNAVPAWRIRCRPRSTSPSRRPTSRRWRPTMWPAHSSASRRTINVIANDTDADGTINPASVIIVTQPAIGTQSPPRPEPLPYTPTAAGTDTFTYNVKDNARRRFQHATVTVSVTSADHRFGHRAEGRVHTATRQWNVEGNTTNLTTPPRTVTIRIGSDLTGQIIGTATVAADGRWKFQLRRQSGNIGPNATNAPSAFPCRAARHAWRSRWRSSNGGANL